MDRRGATTDGAARQRYCLAAVRSPSTLDPHTHSRPTHAIIAPPFSHLPTRSRVLFTSSLKGTAQLLLGLFQAEHRAGCALLSADVFAFGPQPAAATAGGGGWGGQTPWETTVALKLLSSLPGVSVVSALLLLRRFGSLRRVLSASATQLRETVPSLPTTSVAGLRRQLQKNMQALQ
jgi:hypothetical protein